MDSFQIITTSEKLLSRFDETSRTDRIRIDEISDDEVPEKIESLGELEDISDTYYLIEGVEEQIGKSIIENTVGEISTVTDNKPFVFQQDGEQGLDIVYIRKKTGGVYDFLLAKNSRQDWSNNNESWVGHPLISRFVMVLELIVLADLLVGHNIKTSTAVIILLFSLIYQTTFRRASSVPKAIYSKYERIKSLPFKKPSKTDLVVICGSIFLSFILVVIHGSGMKAIGVNPGNSGGHLFTQNMSLDGLYLVTLYMFSFAFFGVVEEVIFRHEIQRDGGEREEVLPIHIWVSALAFGFLHAIAYLPILSPIVSLKLFASVKAILLYVSVLLLLSLLGAVFGYSYEYTDNLTVPALSHALYNCIIVIVIYIAGV